MPTTGVFMGRLIKLGMKGADVRAVQDVLNFHIRRSAPLQVDGKFGTLTHARILQFQKVNQLKPDGIVGPKTMAVLFEEEQLPITLFLGRRQVRTVGDVPGGIQPPRLIPPFTFPPLTQRLVTPFFLPPDSFTKIPALTAGGQTMTIIITTPVRKDPADPATATFVAIIQLLDQLPQNFPFRGSILSIIPRPVNKVGVLELDPVAPMDFGFQWGVDPLFDLKAIGPPPAFAVGGAANARYVLKLIDKPRSQVPQLGVFGQGDFKGTIDWTSQGAQSRPQIDIKGSFAIGVEGRF
ncbi:MAG: hypothetical protein NVSMB6_11320 [Burkholderiaceae bacterium]